MGIIERVKHELMVLNQKYIDESDEGYDFWNMHIKYVANEALMLAKHRNADFEIVELGALLHDIALVSKFGEKADHHTNGVAIARELLEKYNYSKDKMDRVLGCVLNHRKSKNATNIEELCVADADIIAHFHSIYNDFVLGGKLYDFETSEQFRIWLETDFIDLSDEAKKYFKDRYNHIMNS